MPETRMAVNSTSGSGAVVGEASVGDRVRRWVVRGSLTAFALSVGAHLVLMVIAAMLRMGTGQAGGAGERELGGELQMAIMTEEELGAIEEAALEAATPAVTDMTEELPSPEILDGPSASGEAPTTGDLGAVSESLTGAGGDIGDSSGLGESGAGGGGAAKFFGVEAVGTRFAYIVDISGSMQGPKLRELKIELLESIGALGEQMQFYAIPFSTEGVPLGGRTRWTRADDHGKAWARDRTNELNAFGGTNPLTAFQLVFDVTPRPDAIYFMTDGLFDAEVVAEVARMNKRGRRIPVHTIGFDMQDPDAEKLLKRIAEESGGRYSPVGYPGERK